MNLTKVKNDLEEMLSEFRYQHSLRVAELSKELAIQFNFDEEKAYFCGLVHDIAKDLSKEEILKLISNYNLSKDLLEDDNEYLLHSYIGPYLVKEKYGIRDEDILKAILFHTIGNKDMNDFAKIIFLADKLARNNLSEELLKIKDIAFKDLDDAMRKYLEYSD